MDSIRPIIARINYSPDSAMYCVATDQGVRVVWTDPLVQAYYLKFNKVGRIRVAASNGDNLIALVGDSSADRVAKFAENCVIIYNADLNLARLSLTYDYKVLNVILQFQRIVVVTENTVFVHHLDYPHKLHYQLSSIPTGRNPLGLCEAHTNPLRTLVVVPACTNNARHLGVVNVETVTPDMRRTTATGSSSTSPACIDAHEGRLRALALTVDGKVMATCSEKGTVIRVWDVKARMLLGEFRRGTDPACIYSLRFSPDSAYLVTSSDKGTIHVFAITHPSSNRRSLLQRAGIITDEAHRSAAQFTLHDRGVANACFYDDAVHVVCHDGTYHKLSFDTSSKSSPGGGSTDMQRVEFDYFMEVGDNQGLYNVKVVDG